MRALLIAQDAHTTGLLAATRALGQAGWTVGVGSSKRKGFAVSSRWSKFWHSIPSPAENLDAFVAATNRAITDKGYEVVFGAGDAELLALSYCRKDLGAIVPYAPHERVVRALDKLHLITSATRVGLATPKTLEATEDNVARIDRSVIIKSRMHWLPRNQSAPSRLEVSVVSKPDKARRCIAQICAQGGEPLIQEFVSGQLMGMTAITDKRSVVVACMQQLAPLTWQPNAGMPTRAHTVAVNRHLADAVSALLRDLGWYGLVQLQFILPEHEAPRLIDFNGRTYASLALATAAGINFQDMWARLATNRKIEPVNVVCEGMRYQWLEGDLKRALCERRGGLVSDVVSCFRFSHGAVHAVWERNDPWPVFEYPGYLLAAVGNRVRRCIERVR